MSAPAIEVDGLSKAYPVYASPLDVLKELVTNKKKHDEFWALRDISFTLREGQRLGVIGQNGSGKSTLLKIITGHLQPTSGNVKVHGEISAMLSLNTILNPEDTGISNIRFNLLLNGCPRSEIDRLAEEVIDFTELGSFIYSPVKTYSTGMNAKLAFAITTAIDPEILVIDEVLSVGDAYFAGKATQRMKALCDRGKALVLVSHSDTAIREMCDTVIWMENGGVRMFGPVDYVLARYEEDYRRAEDELTRLKHKERKNQNNDGALGLSDLTDNACRVRLVAENTKRHFEDTHYVRRISLINSDMSIFEVPFDSFVEADQSQSPAFLDIFGSEWGRVFGHHNIDCRILGPRTGRSAGGHILVSEPNDVKVVIEALALQGKERLLIEYADITEAKWLPISEFVVKELEGGWVRYSGLLKYQPSSESVDLSREFILENSKPDVEVLEIKLRSASSEFMIVRERESFEIAVQISARIEVPLCDVGIKITRSDGVYCFWQSSGQANCNLNDFSGKAEVVFNFSDNPFGTGDYSVTAYIADGWIYPDNYPYAEVFDRKVSALTFRVEPEFDRIDFGCVNVRASVTMECIEE